MNSKKGFFTHKDKCVVTDLLVLCTDDRSSAST